MKAQLRRFNEKRTCRINGIQMHQDDKLQCNVTSACVRGHVLVQNNTKTRQRSSHRRYSALSYTVDHLIDPSGGGVRGRSDRASWGSDGVVDVLQYIPRYPSSQSSSLSLSSPLCSDGAEEDSSCFFPLVGLSECRDRSPTDHLAEEQRPVFSQRFGVQQHLPWTENRSVLCPRQRWAQMTWGWYWITTARVCSPLEGR